MPRNATTDRRRYTLRLGIGLLVTCLVGLLLASAAATLAVRVTVSSAQHTLTGRVLPARQGASDLGRAYVDEESGQWGYLLTGDPRFLEPYTDGQAAAGRLTADLTRLLADDPAGRRALDAVTAAATTWRTTVAEPAIAARRAGAPPAAGWAAVGLDGKAQFDQLRARLATLERHTADAASAQVTRIGAAQATANGGTIAAVALAVAVAAGGALVFRRRFTRPLDRLVAQVQAVADGDHDAHITPVGPRELALIAESVDRMRGSIVARSRELVSAQRDLTLREEHDRLATDLHDLTIQRVFGLGLGLTSITRRQPGTAAALAPLIAETDKIIREVRAVIFDLERTEEADGLRARVLDLAEQSVRALGFPPALEFAGPIDTAVPEEIGREAVAVLREALSNVARHSGAGRVAIRLAAEDGALTLTVVDDGTGPGPDGAHGDGVASMRSRAARLGGHAEVGPGETAGTVVEWRVPLGQDAPTGCPWSMTKFRGPTPDSASMASPI